MYEKIGDMKKENMNKSYEQEAINDEDGISEYEKMLRKLEGENRNHIKIEHMMKIHCDSLQEAVDELEKSKVGYKEKIKQLQDVSIYIEY